MKELLKNKKLVIAICVAVVLAIGIAIWAIVGGGGSGESHGKSTADVLNLMEKSKAAYENVSSVHGVMNMDMQMSIEDMEMNLTVQMGVYRNKSGDIQKTENIVTLGGFGSQATTSYIDEKNNIVYTTDDGGSSWSKEKISADEAELYMQSADFSQLLTEIRNYKEVGPETVNGIAAMRYDGAIESDKLGELMDQTGLLDSLGTEEMTDKQKQELKKKIGDITVSLWIDPNTDLPQKLSIDMTNMMKSILEISEAADSAATAAAEAVSKVTMVYTNSEYNSLAPIELPSEAKSAK